MNVHLEQYRVFIHVARAGSITTAAETLHITQPAVSQAVRNLEKTLGGTLFVRTSRGVRLTPEGEVLYSYASRGYDYLEQAENKFRELLTLEEGEIRIGASDMTLRFYLLPHLERFHKSYPKIRMRVTNGPTPETLRLLQEGRIDFGVVSSPVAGGENLKISPVRRIRDIFIANEKFSGLRDRTLEPADLERFPLICLERNTSTRTYVENFFHEHGATMNAGFELATSELIVQFALRGLGLGCVVEDFAAAGLSAGDLFEVKLVHPVPDRDMCVAASEALPMSPAGRMLLSGLYHNL